MKYPIIQVSADEVMSEVMSMPTYSYDPTICGVHYIAHFYVTYMEFGSPLEIFGTNWRLFQNSSDNYLGWVEASGHSDEFYRLGKLISFIW